MQKSTLVKMAPVYVKVKFRGEVIFKKIFEHFPVTIGRSLHCDVPLHQFKWLSRNYAEVVGSGGKHMVRVLGQGKNIPFDRTLKLSLGELELIFVNVLAMEEKAAPMEVKTAPGSEKIEPVVSAAREASPPKPPSPPHIDQKIQRLEETREITQIDQKMDGESTNVTYIPQGKASYKGVRGSVVASPENNRVVDFATTENFDESQAKSMRACEAFLVWRGKIYDTRTYREGESISVGTKRNDLYAPSFNKSQLLAVVSDGQTSCRIPADFYGEVKKKSGNEYTFTDLVTELQANSKKPLKSLNFSFEPGDICWVELDDDLTLHMRFIVPPPRLAEESILDGDASFKKMAAKSLGFHLVILALCLIFAPKKEVPKIKDIPPRIAKLLIQKPEPEKPPEPKKEEEKPKPKPPEPPKEKKIVKVEPVKKKPIKKVIKPKKKKLVKRKIVPKKKIIEQPVQRKVVRQPVPEAPQQQVQDINQVGALAALSSLSSSLAKAPTDPVDIKVEVRPDAGGVQSASNTAGLMNSMKAMGGKLPPAGGSLAVGAPGKGFGKGTSYGIRGVAGKAGSRKVAAVVVGAPKLKKLDAKQEGLTKKQVMGEIKKHLGKIQHCYERALLTNSSLVGKVEYEWLIEGGGKVIWAKVKSSNINGGDTLNTCVVKVIKGIRFPVAKNGLETQPSIGFPFGKH